MALICRCFSCQDKELCFLTEVFFFFYSNWPTWDTADCNGRSSPEAPAPIVAGSNLSSCDTEDVTSTETVRPSSPAVSLPSPYSPPLSPSAEDSRVVEDRPNAEVASNGSPSHSAAGQNGVAETTNGEDDVQDQARDRSALDKNSDDVTAEDVRQEAADTTAKGLDTGM